MDNLTPITREEMLMNDEPLTPITREEKILAGEDLKPVTRREYFLKKYRHAGGDVMVEGLEVTANGTYTAPEGKAYSPVNVAVPLAEKSVTENGVYNASADSVAGYSKVNVNVPLPENAYLLKTASGSLVSFSDGADLPMPSFVCDIDAVQDLHGYDSPWVGGAGKNIFCTDVTAIDKTTEYRPNSSQRAKLTQISDNSFRATGNNGKWTAGYYEIDGINGTLDYAISYTIKDNNTSYTPTLIKDAHSDENKLVLCITFNNNSTLTTSEGATFDNVQVELGETATAYAPYSNICPISGHTGVDAVISPTTEASAGTTYSVSWQTEAGEVFGGYVDLVSGELTITHKYKLFDGTEAWTITTSSSGSNYITIDDMKVGTRMDGICNFFDTAIEGASTENAGKCQFGNNNQRFYILNAKGVYDADTQAKMRALTTGMEIVYELATPITYQLTPTQIKSLLGNNNAWCSTGDVAIDYFAKEV